MKSKHLPPLLLSLIVFLSFSCQTKQLTEELNAFKQKETLEKKNIEIAEKSIKYLDTSDYDSLKMICTDDFKLYFNSIKEPVNLNDFIPTHKMFYSAFPDYTHTIENIVASENYVIMQFLMTGTHKNEYYGIPSTNNKVIYKGIQILKIKEGKIEAVYAIDDDLTMLKQLGLELK